MIQKMQYIDEIVYSPRTSAKVSESEMGSAFSVHFLSHPDFGEPTRR
jgi:hypothetical protein